MTDLELQTLIKNACKAAGWRIKKIGLPENSGSTCVWIDDAPVIVRLTVDDGDSRMLQVKCKIDLYFYTKGDGRECVSAGSNDGEHEAIVPLGADASEAARAAVLKCAAMIGEAMP